jgi:ribosomal protein L44E
MPRKNRTYAPSAERKDPHHVGTIEASTLRKFEKAGRRMLRVALETRPGAGAHGEPNKRSKHRADRRNGKNETRNWSKDV